MHLRKKVALSIFLWGTVGIAFSFPLKLGAHSLKNIEIQGIDHHEDGKKAKKWAKAYYESWQKKLTNEEKKSLHKLLDPIDQIKEENNMNHINHQLKVYGGNLTARPTDVGEETKRLEKHIKRITGAIKRKEGVLANPLIVYKNETLHEVLHMDDHDLKNEDGLLNEEKVQQLRRDFITGQHTEFRIYDLYENTNKNGTIKWKIELPRGTFTGLIGEDKVIIDKDSGFKITQLKIIIQKGKQFLRIEAKLIPKIDAEKETDKITDKMQHDFAAALGLSPEKKFIDFKLTGSASYFIAKNTIQLTDKFVTLINPSLLRKTLQYITNKNGSIFLTDQELYTLPQIYVPFARSLDNVINMMQVVGFYNINTRSVYAHLPTDLRSGIGVAPDTLFHEFAHGVDVYGAEVLKMGIFRISESLTFKTLFEEEGKNLTEYGRMNPHEFFAEAFWLFHFPEQSAMQEKAPKTFAFILATLESLTEAMEK